MADAPQAQVGGQGGGQPDGPGRYNLLCIILAQLGVHSAMAGTRMAAPLEALKEGYGTLAAGALLALFAIAPVALALPAGRMADRHGYHRPMRIAVALTVIGTLLAVAATWLDGAAHFIALAGAGLLCGAGANAAVITTQRSVGRAANSSVERVRVFSWLGMAPALANAVGPVVAGFAIDYAGYGTAYALMAALALSTLLLLPWVARDAGVRTPRDRKQTAWSLLRAPGFKRLLVVNWLVSASWDVHNFAVPVLGHERGYGASTIGLILGAFTLSVTAVRFVIPALAARLDEVHVIRAAMVGTALTFAAYPWMPGPAGMAACAVVLGVMLGSVQPMILSTLMRITPEGRHGEAIALRSMALNATSAAMPLAFGAAGAVVGASVLFWMMGAAVGLGQGVAARLRS